MAPGIACNTEKLELLSQVAADLASRIIEKSQRKDFEIVKSFAHFLMNAFAELLSIYTRILQRDTHKRSSTIFLLKGIMHTWSYSCFKHDTPARWHIDFPTIDR